MVQVKFKWANIKNDGIQKTFDLVQVRSRWLKRFGCGASFFKVDGFWQIIGIFGRFSNLQN